MQSLRVYKTVHELCFLEDTDLHPCRFFCIKARLTFHLTTTPLCVRETRKNTEKKLVVLLCWSFLAEMLQVETILFLIFVIGMCVCGQDPASRLVSDRYAVYWNRTNPR